MGENENGLDIVLTVREKAAIQALKNVVRTINSVYDAVDKYSQLSTEAVANFDKLTSSILRLDKTTPTTLAKKFEEAAAGMNKFMNSIDVVKMNSLSSTLQSVSSATDMLTKSFTKLSKISGGDTLDFTNLSNVDVTPLTTLSDKLKDFSADKLNASSDALNKMISAMKKLESIKFSDPTSNTTGIDTKMNTMTASLQKYVEMISKFNLNGLASFTKDIQALPKMMKSMETINMATVTNNIDMLTKKLQSFIATLKEGSADIRNFSTIVQSLGRGVSTTSLTNGVNSTTSAISNMGTESEKTNKKLRNMLSFGKLYAFYNQMRHYGKSFLDMLNQSIDFAEIENYFSRAMGNMRSEAMDFQEKLADMFGLAQPQMMQAQATFKNMLGSIGDLSDEMTYMLSERVTAMALDFSSLYNTTIDSAMTKFQAALSKQVRPIRSVSGYDITQNVLGATAQDIGITDRTITQMNELEKRLMVILTLQKQMMQSSAMGDFARTIEQPANQLRILQQQLSEVGRWISAVFYGTIAQVLPYINGFVMAIKEIVKTFALFLGYEMPDSSGQTGTILDGIEDTFGGVSDSVDDVNSGLSGTNNELSDANKKAKEFKAYLASFDVAQVIPSQSDSDSGKDSSGTGGMTVDPRILDALNKYKYLFDDIRMKATDIRDKLLSWKDAIGKAINENVFQPLQNSWDKYGASIIKNLKDTGTNIGSIFSDIFDVAGKKWKPFFQAASDLFFSLLDTATLVLTTIQKFFIYIWDSGGKYLFEKIWDLATSLIKLATSVNDNFIKPLINGIKLTLVPAFGVAFGIISGLVGGVIETMSDLINVIVKCKPLVVLLGTAFTTMFLAIKVIKLIELFTILKNSFGTMTAFKVILLDHSAVLRKLYTKWIDAGGAIQALKTSWVVANTAIANTTAWQALTTCIGKVGTAFTNGIKHITDWVTNLLFGTTATDVAAVSTTALGVAEETTAVQTGILGTALKFLTNNPMFLVIGAIAAVVGALVWLGSSQKDATYEMEDYSQSVQDQINRINDLKTSMDDAKKSAEDRMASSEAEIKTLDLQIETLKKMGGESGYVGNMAAAEKLVEEINQKLPDTVKLTEDGRLEWQKTPEEIKKCIEALKEKARVEAYSELYTEAIKTQIKAQREHGKAVEDLTTKEQRMVDLQQRQAELQEIFKKHDYRDSWWQTDEAKAYSVELGNIKTELEQLPADIDGLKIAVNDSSDAYSDASTEVEYWGNALSSNNDVMKSTSAAMSGLTDDNRECINNLGSSLSSVKNQLEDYTNGSIELDEKQVRSAQEAKENILLSYAERANEYGKTYDQMIQILMEQGISLTDEEMQQLKESIDNFKNGMSREEQEFKNSKKNILALLKTSNKDMTKETEKEYTSLLDALKKHGGKIGTEYSQQYNTMLKMLENHGYKMDSEQADVYANMFSLLQEYGFDFNEEQTKQFSDALDLAIKSGDTQGTEFLSNLKNSITKDSIEPEARAQWWKAQNVFYESVNGKVTITNADSAASNARSTVTNGVSNIQGSLKPTLNNVSSAFGNVLSYFYNKDITAYLGSNVGNKNGVWWNLQNFLEGHPFEVGVNAVLNMTGAAQGIMGMFNKRAGGGFPDIGEAFIAREAGPEFVGTLNGRTAVANNYQIENGIYRAVKSAMQGSSNGKQSIHLTFNMPDGTKIEKVIDDYNDFIKRNGGNGGFNI